MRCGVRGGFLHPALPGVWRITCTASSSISKRSSACGPTVAEDVLVERLAAADPEREATLQQYRARSRRPARTIAGSIRMVGQVTAVVTLILGVARAR